MAHTATVRLAPALAASVAAFLAAGVRSANAGEAALPGTYVTLGAYGTWEPRFEGSRRHDLGVKPIIGWRSQGERQWLDMPHDGLDIEIIETSNFRAGPVANIRWARDTDSLVRGFRRVGSVDVSLEFGGFAEFWPADWLRTRAELRYATVGAEGFVADLSADAVWHPTDRWTLTAGPRVSFGDDTFMKSYYSVTPSQSATSGLPVYDAGAGLRSYGAGSLVRYKVTEAITTSAFVEYSRISGAAADSPLTTTRGQLDQLSVGLGLSYTFRAPW